MKQQQTVALSAIVAVAIGLSGIGILADASTQPELTEAELIAEQTGFAGHLEAVLTNSDGEVIAYRQTDNVVMTEGKDCVLEIALAGTAITSNSCSIATIDGAQFNAVHLISANTPLASDDPDGTTTGTLITGVSGLAPTTCAYTDGTDSAVCTATYTGGTGINQAVTGAYLADATSSPAAYFAGNTFTSVTMTEADVLTVTWTISLTG
jgi:hypothetical protein